MKEDLMSIYKIPINKTSFEKLKNNGFLFYEEFVRLYNSETRFTYYSIDNIIPNTNCTWFPIGSFSGHVAVAYGSTWFVRYAV